MKKFDLIPYDRQKSYYGKAIVTETDGKQILTSYKTDVAMIEKDGSFLRLWDGYSATTMKHINSFRVMNNLETIGKKQWLEMKAKNDSNLLTASESLKIMYSRRNEKY